MTTDSTPSPLRIYHALSTSNLTELFRRRVISYFVNKKLLNEKFARNLLSWKHSGFSVDNSILIPPQDQKARTDLSQYIARPKVL